jgi:hypothetical protein
MLILMSALKQHKAYATPQLSIFIEMEKGLMRCLAQERRDYMIGFGCILDAYLLSLASALTVLMNCLCECDLYFFFSVCITSNRVLL